MRETELFVTTDHQISYDLTISTMQRMFNREIEHCYEDIDVNIAEYLEHVRDEFLFLFQHAYKDEEYRNNQSNQGS